MAKFGRHSIYNKKANRHKYSEIQNKIARVDIECDKKIDIKNIHDYFDEYYEEESCNDKM